MGQKGGEFGKKSLQKRTNGKEHATESCVWSQIGKKVDNAPGLKRKYSFGQTVYARLGGKKSPQEGKIVAKHHLAGEKKN